MPHDSRAGLDGFDSLPRCRALRHTQTSAEARLWHRLRNRALGGLKFRRQQPFGDFILDFYCHEARLVIEVDGFSHSGGASRFADAQRTAFLERYGLHVLRFSNQEVFERIDSVAERIWEAARERGAARRPRPPDQTGGPETSSDRVPSS
jgi:very-short-patch-repair endonuclease